jgi:uncharacterized membrane-anchored protein
MRRRSRRTLLGAPVLPISGVARVDPRTKNLVTRLGRGEIAIINHPDLDRVAAEMLVNAAPAAVINAAPSVTGRYPNLGPMLLCQAGIPLVDDTGDEVMTRIADGDQITLDGEKIAIDGEVVANGVRQDLTTVTTALENARHNLDEALEQFAENTGTFLRQEFDMLTGQGGVPETHTSFAGRHALIVVRGIDYKEDLALLRRSGYLREVRPILVGVDGGADALLEIGEKPDVIIGDFDSVSESTIRCGAELIVHGFTDGRAPGAERLDQLGVPYSVFAAPGTSEDIAMLLAFEHGAELLVAVGSHNSMIEFLDKGRAGMASTFLVRMKVGSVLVDAKGVSRLYQHRVRTRDLLVLIGATIFTFAVVLSLSEPVRLVLRALWLSWWPG